MKNDTGFFQIQIQKLIRSNHSFYNLQTKICDLNYDTNTKEYIKWWKLYFWEVLTLLIHHYRVTRKWVPEMESKKYPRTIKSGGIDIRIYW